MFFTNNLCHHHWFHCCCCHCCWIILFVLVAKIFVLLSYYYFYYIILIMLLLYFCCHFFSFGREGVAHSRETVPLYHGDVLVPVLVTKQWSPSRWGGLLALEMGWGLVICESMWQRSSFSGCIVDAMVGATYGFQVFLYSGIGWCRMVATQISCRNLRNNKRLDYNLQWIILLMLRRSRRWLSTRLPSVHG